MSLFAVSLAAVAVWVIDFGLFAAAIWTAGSALSDKLANTGALTFVAAAALTGIAGFLWEARS